VTFLQRTFTSLVHAHAGRTQDNSRRTPHRARRLPSVTLGAHYMKDRHQILDDKSFWITLEFKMSGRLSESSDKEARKYWIDGFIPQFITDTNTGANVEGDIWVAEGQKRQVKCRFLTKVPQKLLYRKIRDFDYQIVTLDVERKYVELNIKQRKPNNAA